MDRSEVKFVDRFWGGPSCTYLPVVFIKLSLFATLKKASDKKFIRRWKKLYDEKLQDCNVLRVMGGTYSTY
jgi:hypothetical protein